MKTYYDTSVLLAALIDVHENHLEAFYALQAANGQAQGVICAYALAECYSVLTGARAYRNLISPAEIGFVLRENMSSTLEIVALSADDYLEVIRKASESGLLGGKIYDALHLAAASKAECEVIYTFNVRHFRELAPDLATRIRAPQLP